jgi:hypothetical protein
MSKFASITAGLLARKGEARPWSYESENPPMPEKAPPLVWRPEPVPQLSSIPPPPPGKDRSCSVRMSAQDFERLGILAVKRGVTRQRLMKDALAQLLASQAKIFACACMGQENKRSCEKNCD